MIRRNPDGSWHGDMLDGLAFVKAQRDRGTMIDGSRALLVGTGAAGSAIAYALLDAGIAELALHDADPARVTALSEQLAEVSNGRLVDGSSDPTGFDLVFNATPLGLEKSDPSPVDTDRLTARMHVGDVIAGYGTTALIAAAKESGCTTADGGHMVEAVQGLMTDFMLDE